MLIANTSAIQVSQVEQGLAIARQPCARHAKRISELVKAVENISVNGIRTATKMATVWTVVKISGTVLASVAGLLFAAWRVIR